MYDTIFFDLDGTLTDSAPGILNAVRYALRRKGMPVPPEAALRRFIGPPLRTEFQAVFGVSEAESMALIEEFQVYYAAGGMFENRPYDGIGTMLERLRASGRRAVVTTSKPEPSAVQILEHYGLARYFEAIIGSAPGERERSTKALVVAHALKTVKPEKVLLVGDRIHDIEGAHANGIPCVGVLYGYGSRDELREAEWITETVQSLLELLVSL